MYSWFIESHSYRGSLDIWDNQGRRASKIWGEASMEGPKVPSEARRREAPEQFCNFTCILVYFGS